MGVRVAHFISTSGLYGAERWILGLLGNIKGVDTLLICSNYDDPSLLNEAKKKGIRTSRIDAKGNFAVPDFIRKLSSIIKKEEIDVLHTHGYKADMIGYFAARRAGIKIVSTPHGWSMDAGMKLRTYEALDRFFLRFFDIVAPHTRAFRESLGHIKRIRWINNFVDLSTIPKPEKGDPRLITYIGQLIERKRVQDLIISLKHVRDRKVRLQVIGDGPQKGRLRQLTAKMGLQGRVKFLGFRDDRLDLLNRSGILVLPSLLEWIPRVMMEAMAMQRAVIGADIAGIRELIKHMKTGLLVPVKSPEKIAESVDYILENPKQAGKMAEKARDLIEKEFSAERAAKEYEELYLGLAGPRQK